MKAVAVPRSTAGPRSCGYEDAPGSAAGARPGDRARARLRAESSRSLAAPRSRSRADPAAAHFRQRLAGEVVDGGRRVRSRHARDAAAGPALRPRAPPAREGRDNQCAEYNVLGYMSDGGYAELVSVPVENLIPIPAHVDFVSAAAFPLTFLTAWHMLLTRARAAARVRPCWCWPAAAASARPRSSSRGCTARGCSRPPGRPKLERDARARRRAGLRSLRRDFANGPAR